MPTTGKRMNTVYKLKAGRLELRLEVVEVGSLLQHEQTLPGAIKKLTFEFKNWANLQNPIIIDENHVVLDGNHRAGVFQALDFKYIPVCKIDYFNPDVLLKYWFRLFKPFNDVGRLKDIIDAAGATVEPLGSKERLQGILKTEPLAFGFQLGTAVGVARFRDVTDAVGAYDALESLQDAIKREGAAMEYVPCKYLRDEDFCSRLGSTDLVIFTPHITKDMVVHAARDGKVFAPKTTRHVIPARPLNVNAPVRWFNDGAISLASMNDKFKLFLEGKKVRHFGPGQVIDGRYYQEATFVFM